MKNRLFVIFAMFSLVGAVGQMCGMDSNVLNITIDAYLNQENLPIANKWMTDNALLYQSLGITVDNFCGDIGVITSAQINGRDVLGEFVPQLIPHGEILKLSKKELMDGGVIKLSELRVGGRWFSVKVKNNVLDSIMFGSGSDYNGCRGKTREQIKPKQLSAEESKKCLDDIFGHKNSKNNASELSSKSDNDNKRKDKKTASSVEPKITFWTTGKKVALASIMSLLAVMVYACYKNQIVMPDLLSNLKLVK